MLLLVEDEPLLLRSAERLFEARGFDVISVGDGAQALQASGLAPRVDLLVTDISLPGIDGIELAVRLRETRPGLPVLFMSGLEAELADIRLPEGGTWAFLPKPFAVHELDTRLALLLGPGAGPGPERRG